MTGNDLCERNSLTVLLFVLYTIIDGQFFDLREDDALGVSWMNATIAVLKLIKICRPRNVQVCYWRNVECIMSVSIQSHSQMHDH